MESKLKGFMKSVHWGLITYTAIIGCNKFIIGKDLQFYSDVS